MIRRFQFSLRACFAAMTLTTVCFAVLSWLPDEPETLPVWLICAVIGLVITFSAGMALAVVSSFVAYGIDWLGRIVMRR